MSPSFDHLFILVRDLERSLAFYERLGFMVERWGDGYARISDETGWYLGVEEGSNVGAPGVELVVRVDDVDRCFHELIAGGVAFEGTPEDQPWGARHVWLTDPDGYRLSLFSGGDRDQDGS
jgi:catechol 2,3-dioxygenase-like lactoylglutathione lyase family enzyme